ncbi:MAG: RsmE family RNA methyltransferase, partial [Spirulinaceae cyanobacterium]
ILRCCTELGVTTFCPVTSDRTLPQPNPKKLTRWRKIVAEAAEQSERAIVPGVQPVMGFSAVLQQLHLGQRYLCVARGDRPSLMSRLIPPAPLGKGGDERSPVSLGKGVEVAPAPLGQAHPAITIATGPEGGWTPTEIEQAVAAGFDCVGLGSRVLRAVTAAIAATTIAMTAVESDLKIPSSD